MYGLFDTALSLYSWVILARVVLSWIQIRRRNEIIQLIYKLTEPVLEPIRRRLPSSGIDFSPLIVFFLIILVRRMILPAMFL